MPATLEDVKTLDDVLTGLESGEINLPPTVQGTMFVLGDKDVTNWDPSDPSQVQAATERFEKLRKSSLPAAIRREGEGKYVATMEPAFNPHTDLYLFMNPLVGG